MGKEQHVSVPVSSFDEDKFEEGHAFDGSSIRGWKGIEASDMLLMPDPDSARMDPFTQEPTLILTCDVVDPANGKGYERILVPLPNVQKPISRAQALVIQRSSVRNLNSFYF